MSLSERCIITSDWHFGANGNDPTHNEDLLDFVDFLVDYSSKEKIKNLYFAGDLFEHRDKIDVNTINYALTAMEEIASTFNAILIPGNHDLYYKDTLDITSLSIFDSRLKVLREPLQRGNILLTPWVVNQQQFEDIVKLSQSPDIEYVIGHFEFSGFKMNDHYVMEHGYSHKAFKHLKQVFTGHYHARQQKGNTVYIGTPFPFNFNDSNDKERGFIDFNPATGNWKWVNYDNISVVEADSSDFLEGAYDHLNPEKTKIKIVFSEEDANESQYDAVYDKLSSSSFRKTKIDFKSPREKEVLEQDADVGEIKSIDGMVIETLKNMTPVDGIDNELLVKIYLEAKENG